MKINPVYILKEYQDHLAFAYDNVLGIFHHYKKSKNPRYCWMELKRPPTNPHIQLLFQQFVLIQLSPDRATHPPFSNFLIFFTTNSKMYAQSYVHHLDKVVS